MDSHGQALISIVSILSVVFLAVAVAVSLGFLNIYRAEATEASQTAFYGAESGVQEAVLKLKANDKYKGETFHYGEVSVVVTVTPSGIKDKYTVSSSGQYLGKMRRVEALATKGKPWTISGWREKY